MKNFLQVNPLFWTVGSPNQTDETQTRENRVGLMSYLRRTLMLLFAVLVMSIANSGMAWGADFDAATMATTSGSTPSDHIVVKSAYSATGSGNVCNTSQTVISIGSSANANWDTNFIEVKADGAGYTIDSPISITASANKKDGSTNSIVAVFWTGDAGASFASMTTFVIPNKNVTGDACGPVDVAVPSGTKTIRIYRQIKYSGTSFDSQGSAVGFGSGVYVKNISATASGGASSTKYTLSYDANGKDGGGEAPTDASSPYASGSNVTVLGNTNSMTKTGYSFGGWNTAANGSGTSYAAGGTISSIAANTTLYAKWTQDITLDREGASTGSTSVTATYNCATLPSITNPTKEGYAFKGWYTGDDGTGTLVINTSGELQANVSGYTGAGGIWTSSSAQTLYAKWEQFALPATLDKSNVSAVSDDTYWSTDNTYYDYGSEDAANTSRYQDWVVYVMPCTYEVSVVMNYSGGVTGTQWGLQLLDAEETVVASYNSIQLWSTTSTTYAAKWDLSDVAEGTYTLRVKNIFDHARPKLKSLTLSATTYTVTYDAEGGSCGKASEKICGGESVTLPEPTRSGYSFDGWYNSSDVKIGDADDSYEPSDDITLYAKWTFICSEPTSLTNGMVTMTSQAVSWTAGDSETEWDVYYSTSSGTPAADQTPTYSPTSASYTFTGLTKGTTYYWWVRAKCSETSKSDWVAGTSFTTNYCDVFSFHNGTDESSDWTIDCFEKVGDTHEWQITNFVIPDKPNYYVGKYGYFYDKDLNNEEAKSYMGSWEYMYFAGSQGDGAGTRPRTGEAEGAVGTVRIYDNSTWDNLQVAFIPNGFKLKIGSTEYPFAFESGQEYRSGIVEYGSSNARDNVSVGIVDASGDYVATANSQGMQHIFLNTGGSSLWSTGGVTNFGIYDVTNSSWACLMTLVPGESYLYEGWVPSNCTTLSIHRLASSSLKWKAKDGDATNTNVYNSTNDLVLQSEKNLWTVTGWGGGDGNWSAYVKKGKYCIWDNSIAKNWGVCFHPYHVLSFDANGGSGAPSAQSVAADGNEAARTIEITSTVPTRTGYTFLGWNPDDDNADAGTKDGDYDPEDEVTLSADVTLYAVWEAKTYDLTLDINGASSGSEAVTMTYNSSSHTSITAPTKAGYTFEGWYDSESNNNGTGNLIMNASGVLQANAGSYTGAEGIWILDDEPTLYAKWSCTSPTFDTDLSTSTVNVNQHASASALSVVASAGGGTVTYQWYSNTANSTTTPTPSPISGATSASYTPSTETAGTTYYFCEAKNTTGGNCTTNSSITPVTVTATYRVNYNGNGKDGGSDVASSAWVTSGTDVTTVANTWTKSGYKFKWWNTDDEGDGEDFYVGEKVTMASADVTLYAQWEEVDDDEEFWCGSPKVWHATTHDVTVGDMNIKPQDYSSNDNMINDDFTGGNKKYTIVNATEKRAVVMAIGADDKYVEIHFTDGSPINELKLGVTTSATTDQNIVVCYSTKDDFSTGEYEFVKVGSTDNVVSVPGNNQSTKSVTDVSPSTENKYKYVRIYRKLSNGTDYNSTGSALGSSDAKARIYSIKAKKGTESYSITYDCDGADSGCPLDANYQTALPNPLPSAPSKSGYSFGGWYTDEEFTELAEAGATLTADATLYAKWLKLYTVTKGSLSNGDITISPTSAISGATISIAASANTGYSFTSWTITKTTGGDDVTSTLLGDNSTTSSTSFTMPAYDVTVVATFTVNHHTLTWDFDGGSTSATAGTNYTAGGDVNYGTDITYPGNATMSKTGYIFNSWSTSATTMPDNDLTITASWTRDVKTASWGKDWSGTAIPNATTSTVNSVTLNACNSTKGALWEKESYTMGNGDSVTINLASGYYISAVSTAALFDEYGGNTNKLYIQFNSESTYSDPKYDLDDPITLGDDCYDSWGTLGSATPVSVSPISAGAQSAKIYCSGNSASGNYLYRIIVEITAWDCTPSTVTFAAGGGTGAVPLEREICGDITLPGPGSLKKKGNTFAGWSDGVNNYNEGDTYTVAGDVTLTALWTPFTVPTATGLAVDEDFAITWNVPGKLDLSTASLSNSDPDYFIVYQEPAGSKSYNSSTEELTVTYTVDKEHQPGVAIPFTLANLELITYDYKGLRVFPAVVKSDGSTLYWDYDNIPTSDSWTRVTQTPTTIYPNAGIQNPLPAAKAITFSGNPLANKTNESFYIRNVFYHCTGMIDVDHVVLMRKEGSAATDTTEAGTSVLLYSGIMSHYTDETIEPGKTYYYTIFSVHADGTLSAGTTQSATVPKDDLDVTATAGTASLITQTSATLSFTLSSTTGVASVTLKVYDSEDELVATVAGVTAATSGSGEITGLDAGTTYYFTVTPIGDVTHNDGAESTKSSTFTTETCTPHTVSKVTMSAYNSGSKSGYNNDEYAGMPKYNLSSVSGEGSTHKGYKLGSGGHYIYAQLGKGSFEEGDVIKVYVSKPNDAYKVEKVAQTILDLYIHDGSSTHTLLHTIEDVDAEGEYTYTLTASDITTIGAYKYIGVYRPSSDRTQNPYIYSVEIEGCRSWTPSHDVSTVVSGSVGGTVSAAASSVMEGGTTTITATPATGYEVTNWAVSGTGASIDPSGASNETEATLTMGTADATVTVTFGLADYSVTYNGNSPTSGSAPTDGNTYNYNDDVTVLGDNSMSKTGYTFRGWTDGITFYKAGEKFKLPAEDVTLTAVWESNSGSETITITDFATSNTNCSAGVPDDNGKYFYGYKGSVSAANAVTLTSNDGNDCGQNSGVEMRLTYNKKMRVYANNTTDAAPQTFKGVTGISFKWMFIASGNSGKTELTSSYTVKVGSTTVANAVSITGKTNDGYATVNLTSLANLDGYVEIQFGGSSSSYNVYLDDIAITYASPYFDVDFDDMTGFTGSSTLPSTITGVPSGNKIQEPATEPEAAGYDFDGWYTDASCESAVNWSTMTITTDKTIYAKWTEAEYSITYKDKGDETFTGGGSLPDTHTYGTITLLEDATKTGYRFDGWYENAACTGYRKYNLGATSYTDDITLYAKWTLVVDDDNENFEGYDTPSSYNDVLITNGATLTISEDKTVQDITVETGSTLNIAKDGESGITFTVNSLSLVGGWGLVDGKKKYDMPRVFIDQASTLTKTGGSTVNLDVALDNDNYYPIAVPFPVDVSAVDYADPYLAGFSRYGFSGQYAIKKYNGQQRADRGANYANWEIMNDGVDVGYGSGTETLVPGRGYIVTALPVPGEEYAVLRFPMTVDNKWTTEGEQGSITVKVEEEDVTTTKNVVRVEAYVKEKGETPKMHKGWNLLGIPYMSCYQTGSDMYAGGGAAAIMQGKFDFSTNQFDDEDPIRYVSVPTHNFSEYLQYNIVDEETKLLPGWCFFVQVETTGDLTYVAAKETASGLLYAPKREQEHKPTIKTGIILSSETASDKTTFLISDKYSAAEYEINADLEKMFGENSYTLATYSLSNETRLAYNAMSRADAANVIPIGYRAPAEGEYTFAINPRYAESGDFERIDLIDYETGFVTNLLQSSYTFTSDRTQSDSRFALNVVPQKETPTGLENDANDANGVRKVIIDNKLYIILNGKMYDAKGVMVK